MADLPEIPLENGTPLELLRRYPGKARALRAAAANTFGLASRLAAAIAAPMTDKASRAWLARQDNPYLAEIDAMADAIGVAGVHSLNVCFEWGCTSGVWPSSNGPVLRRVMDWPFPAMGENMVVLRQPGDAGEFFAITWPGVSGIFQGVAPGRFAAAINQAPLRKHGVGMAGDWIAGRIAVKTVTALPPAHLLRRVFETAPDYPKAQRLLCETPIAVPAIFILAGTQHGEGCVIERTETDFRLRAMESGSVCTANHFLSDLRQQGRGWWPREIDSAGRAARAAGLDSTHFTEDFGWFTAPIANIHSRLAFNATARDGALTLMGTYAERPVTQVLRLG